MLALLHIYNVIVWLIIILVPIYCKICIKNQDLSAATASSQGAIWDEFSVQNWHQSTKKSTKFTAQLAPF